jgi:hypothetical protein
MCKNGVVRTDNQPHPLREQQGKSRDPHEQRPAQLYVINLFPRPPAEA